MATPTHNIESWYEVRVIQKDGPYRWEVIGKPGSPTAADKLFQYNACPKEINDEHGQDRIDDVIQAGYWAREVDFVEKGSCKSIAGSGLGWFWYRDAQGNARRFDERPE